MDDKDKCSTCCGDNLEKGDKNELDDDKIN